MIKLLHGDFMKRISIVLPKEYLVDLAKEALNKLNIDADIFLCDSNNISEVIKKVHNTKILIARGYQALYFKEHTNIPIVNICLTSNEIALLIKRAKEIINKEDVHIALIGYQNTFGDISHLDEVFDVKLSMYTIYNQNEEECLSNAINDNVDIVIGGNKIVNLCSNLNIKSLFCDSTLDSILNALIIAKKMDETLEYESLNNNQINTLLDVSFNQIYQLDIHHNIEMANNSAIYYLNCNITDLVGKKIEDIFTNLEYDIIESIINKEIEVFKGAINYNNDILNYTIVPILTVDTITKVIVSINLISKNTKTNYNNNLVTFLNIKTKSETFKKNIRLAKLISYSDKPAFIHSPIGLESDELALAIHNFSKNNNNRVIKIIGNSDLDYTIFDKVINIDKNCTIIINKFESLNLSFQYYIYYNFIIKDKNNINYIDKNYRFIFISNDSLDILHLNNLIIDELYYLLSCFEINIPKLNDRYEDLINYIKEFVLEFTESEKKNLIISEETIIYLTKFNYEGNLIQLKQFIKYLILFSPTKVLKNDFIKESYNKIFKEKSKDILDPIIITYNKYNGNRKKMAEELGISTTTLWRKLKKYNLE